MPQSITQSTPDYIAQAQAAVKKYYPKYENYFNEVFKRISIGWYEEYLINEEIKEDLNISRELLNDEKEIITTILISLEKITLDKETFKNNIWISDDDDTNFIAIEIYEWFYNKYNKYSKDLENYIKEFSNLKTKMNNWWINWIWNEYITLSEKYMVLLKEWLLEYGYLIKSKEFQGWIKTYKEMLNNTNKKPSEIGQKYIDAYNKIKKQ